MMIEKISIIPGYDREGKKEGEKEISILKGQKIGILGPTGSGKSQLLYDIDKLAYGETKTGRKILVNGEVAGGAFKTDPTKKIIGYLTQHVNFMTDAIVSDFLWVHIETRGKHRTEEETEKLIEKVIADANTLTGEENEGKCLYLDMKVGA